MVVLAGHSTLGIFSNALLEEVGLALQRDECHPREGVVSFVDLGLAELDKETIGTEFDILCHCLRTDAYERRWYRFIDEFCFDFDRSSDHAEDLARRSGLEQVEVEGTGKVAMQALITCDELI